MTLKELNMYIDSFIERRKDDERAGNIRVARICCVIANANSKKKFKEKDFMPQEKRGALTPEQFVNALKVITMCNGGEIIG
jgi:hypothetical protein